MLTHPGPLTRDTQKYKPLQEIAKNKRPGLKKLSELLLGVQIQTGAHSSVSRFNCASSTGPYIPSH